MRLPRASYANVVATLALFIAVSGGSAWAATNLIHGNQIAKGTITASNVKERSLLAKDFKKDQLPRGAKGTRGPRGAPGLKGGAGSAGAVGPTGSTGATGPAGATGATGSATAYGMIVIQSDGSPTIMGVTHGFSSVTSPQAGVYCLTLAGDALILPPLLVTPYDTTAVFAPTPNVDCSISQFEIKLLSGSAAANTGFVAAVPGP